ncbi:HepT-like ribonuclease domain-containing protein [Gloeobacter violaceus]|uniref:Gsl3523 protein n=1 Tax=Gloeobacter violaceus (strain ATCC 29082 / PCC 7421) TaxID=251221 RepID=Q7NFK2_GLOVI|nr:HepT-like ribonuclease domain-containing protein [Gloeobacter violaceus]BAC91464.1 gsl3523 [Gloeobacter violaceus PCC 7421]
MRSDVSRLEDIAQAIRRIEEKMDLEQFATDEMLQVWVLFHLQIIGEAARSLSQNLKLRYDNVPWSQIIGFCNQVAHEYFKVDWVHLTYLISINA